MTRKADGIRRRWCKPSRPASGRALMGHKPKIKNGGIIHDQRTAKRQT